jgi:hypothetical protein
MLYSLIETDTSFYEVHKLPEPYVKAIRSGSASEHYVPISETGGKDFLSWIRTQDKREYWFQISYVGYFESYESIKHMLEVNLQAIIKTEIFSKEEANA